MAIQLQKAPEKAKQTPTAGPSADDRGAVAKGGKPIDGRLLNIVGATEHRQRIMISGGVAQGVKVGMVGYVKSGADGSIGSFEIESVEDYRSIAVIDAPRSKLRANASLVINAEPPKQIVRRPPRILGRSIAGAYVAIQIGRGGDAGVTVGMGGHLTDSSGVKGPPFSITKVDSRMSYAQLAHTTIDEVARYTEVSFEPAPAAPAAPVQLRAAAAPSVADVQSTARAGVAGAASSLPFLDIIQRSFGKHDVSGVRAQVGGPAAEASHALGAQAYATGNTVAFASSPDLHTAAHEAAHTVQQARGAVGFQGLGAAGDEHERHADAVADAVVAGKSAEGLLDASAGTGASTAIQRQVSEVDRVQDAAQRSPFYKPMRGVLDWRAQVYPRTMPSPPHPIDCQFDLQPAGPRGVHPAQPTMQSKFEMDDTTGAWPAIVAVSGAVTATHARVVDEVTMYQHASTDPALHALLAGPRGTASLSEATNQHRSPERDGMTVADMFDDQNSLVLEESTRAEIARADRPRPATGQAAGTTLEKAAAVRAAIETLKGAIDSLGAARSEVEAAGAHLAAQRAADQADDLRDDIVVLQAETSKLKALVDTSFAVLAGMAHAAAGEVGDTISKVGESVGTLVSRVNERAIDQLNHGLAMRLRTIKTERGRALAAEFDATRASLRAAAHGVEAARNSVVQTMASRSTAYKTLGRAAASELTVSPEEQRKVAAMIAALPLIEHCAVRARNIMTAATLPQYSEPAGRGLWLAHHSNDPKVTAFMRALGETEGVRIRYRSVAVHWEHRLDQVRALGNSVGSHPAE